MRVTYPEFKDRALVFIKELMSLVYSENLAQISKWGVQEHNLFLWGNFLAEEVGELHTAIAEFNFRNGSREDIEKEAVQVATLALKIAEMVKHPGGSQNERRTDK